MKLHRLLRSRAGFTLAETIITAAIALGGIGAAMTLNGAHLKLVKSSRQSNAATLALQERVEQMRIVGWTNLMKESYIKDTFFLKAPESAAVLDDAKERITIAPYDKNSTAKKLIIDRDTYGTRTTVSNGEGLNNEDNSIVKVELRLSWTGSDGRERVRATTTVISNGGINMSSLPAMGTVSGGTNTTSSGTTSTNTGSTSDGSTTTPPADTSSGSGGTTTATPTTTTTTDAGGNTTTTSTTTTTSGGSTTTNQTTTTTDASGNTTGTTNTQTTTTTGNNGNGNGNTSTTTTTTTTDASGNTTSTTTTSGSGNGNGNSSNNGNSNGNNGRGNVNGKPGKN